MNLHPCPLSDALALVESVLKGYPPSMARSDALLACKEVAAQAQGLRERIKVLEASDALQPCGHPKSLVLQSAESGEPLYCEACDDKSGRRDAELRESELAAANVALRERIAELEAQRVPQWISVTERMPEPDSGEVLVWLTGGRCAFDEWHMHREDPTGMSTTHTMEMGLMWRDYEYEDITHWMPLPPPPVERAHGIEEAKR